MFGLLIDFITWKRLRHTSVPFRTHYAAKRLKREVIRLRRKIGGGNRATKAAHRRVNFKRRLA